MSHASLGGDVPHSPPVVTVEPAPGALRVTLAGELDVTSEARLRSVVVEHLGTVESDVVIDLAGVTFIDSTALGVVIALTRRVRHAGFDVLLAGAGAQVHRVFEVTQLDRYFRMFPDADAALASVAGSSAGVDG